MTNVIKIKSINMPEELEEFILIGLMYQMPVHFHGRELATVNFADVDEEYSFVFRLFADVHGIFIYHMQAYNEDDKVVRQEYKTIRNRSDFMWPLTTLKNLAKCGMIKRVHRDRLTKLIEGIAEKELGGKYELYLSPEEAAELESL